jgi:hypothetical protein
MFWNLVDILFTKMLDNFCINIFDGLPKKKHIGDCIRYLE